MISKKVLEDLISKGFSDARKKLNISEQSRKNIDRLKDIRKQKSKNKES